MAGVDKFYILTDNENNDQSPHKWTRADTQREILQRRIDDPKGKRARYLRTSTPSTQPDPSPHDTTRRHGSTTPILHWQEFVYTQRPR